MAAAADDLPDRRRKERSPLPTRNGSRSACTNANRGERGSRQVGEGREGRSRWGTFARGTDDAEPGLPLRPPSAGGRPPAPADQRGAAARLRPVCRAPFRPGARLCVNFDCLSTFGCPDRSHLLSHLPPRLSACLIIHDQSSAGTRQVPFLLGELMLTRRLAWMESTSRELSRASIASAAAVGLHAA